MKSIHFKQYWAGLKRTAGPRPSPACAARARGRGDGPTGRQPPAWLGLASRGRAPHRRLHRRGGVAYLRATLPGHGKPRKSAHKGRGGRAVLMREIRKTEVERFTGAARAPTSLAMAERGRKRSPRPLTLPTTATHGRN